MEELEHTVNAEKPFNINFLKHYNMYIGQVKKERIIIHNSKHNFLKKNTIL